MAGLGREGDVRRLPGPRRVAAETVGGGERTLASVVVARVDDLQQSRGGRCLRRHAQCRDLSGPVWRYRADHLLTVSGTRCVVDRKVGHGTTGSSGTGAKRRSVVSLVATTGIVKAPWKAGVAANDRNRQSLRAVPAMVPRALHDAFASFAEWARPRLEHKRDTLCPEAPPATASLAVPVTGQLPTSRILSPHPATVDSAGRRSAARIALSPAQRGAVVRPRPGAHVVHLARLLQSGPQSEHRLS